MEAVFKKTAVKKSFGDLFVALTDHKLLTPTIYLYMKEVKCPLMPVLILLTKILRSLQAACQMIFLTIHFLKISLKR